MVFDRNISEVNEAIYDIKRRDEHSNIYAQRQKKEKLAIHF